MKERTGHFVNPAIETSGTFSVNDFVTVEPEWRVSVRRNVESMRIPVAQKPDTSDYFSYENGTFGYEKFEEPQKKKEILTVKAAKVITVFPATEASEKRRPKRVTATRRR